jgi:hypothetical protein
VAYATVEELFSWLQLTSPTQLQLEAGQRALDAAGEEIDWELGYTPENPLPSPVPALVQTVNVERAVDHWNQAQSPHGIVGIGSEVPIVLSRDTWYRHARKLAPLKQAWGVA